MCQSVASTSPSSSPVPDFRFLFQPVKPQATRSRNALPLPRGCLLIWASRFFFSFLLSCFLLFSLWNHDARRYDARGALHDLSQHEPPIGGYGNRLDCLAPAEQRAEQLCEEERYYSLYANEVEEEIYQGETLDLGFSGRSWLISKGFAYRGSREAASTEWCGDCVRLRCSFGGWSYDGWSGAGGFRRHR